MSIPKNIFQTFKTKKLPLITRWHIWNMKRMNPEYQYFLYDDIDIQDASLDVVPTKGAVLKADFTARSGKRALLTLKHDQSVVPFGALLSMDGTTSIVGDDGEVYVTGLKGTQRIEVQWGNTAQTKCTGSVSVPENMGTGILSATVNCQ